MKKYILILFLIFTGFLQAQTYPVNPTKFGKISLNTNGVSTSTTKINTQESDGQINYIDAMNLPVPTSVINAIKQKADLSTGLLKNGLISINADPTKFNISAGIGIISNFDDPENPVSTIISFPAFTGVTPTYLLTGNITYIAINSTPAVVMQATPFTDTQRRDLIILGAAIHSNLTNINVVNNISAPSNAIGNQLHDFMEAVGALNITGNKYTANGANLSLNKSAGTIFKFGVNFATNWKDPHVLSQSSGTALTFRYRTQNGTEGSDVTVINPAVYDLNNVLTAVPNNKFSIQTVTMFQTGLTRIQYGQNVYDDLASAQAAIFTRDYNVEANIKENGITRAYIIVKNNATSLQNATDSRIIEAQKFGGVASGGVALTFANIVSALGYTPANDADVVHKTGDENITSGIKRWFGQARFGASDLGSFITTGRHLVQFVGGTDQTPIAIAAGNSSIEYFRDLNTPRYAWATGLQNPSDNLDVKDSFKWFWAKPETPAIPYIEVMKLSEQGNLYTKGNLSENITTITPTISGQPAIISYVNSLNVTQPVKLVIYFHGSGSNQLNPFTDTNSKYVIDKLLSEGYIVATSQAHGNAWGNQASQDDYLALYNYVISNYNINDVVFVGHSMGGITSLNMIAKNTIPAVSRWYGIMPATNLSEAYFTEGFASSIETAYGFSGSANYAAATAGNDPNLYAGSAYVNKKYTMTASSGDLTIIKTTNADLFNTKLTGAGISSYIVTATGVHGDISHFIPKHIFSFFRGTTVVKASQNVLPRVDNNGDLVDSAILDDGVNLNLTRNYRLTNSTPTSSLINSGSSNKRWDMRVNGTSFQVTESGVGNPFTIAAGGLSTFTGNIIIPNGTISTHGVNKGQLDLKADLASPALTGTPTAPTATAGTNTTQLATTAFVQSATRPYKSYTAIFNQSGTSAPTAPTIFENTIGAIVWTRTTTGTYVGTLSGAFTASKTIAFLTNTSVNSATPINVKISSASVNTIDVLSYVNGALADNAIGNMSLEIRVYN